MSETIKVRVASRQVGGHRRIGRYIPQQETDIDVTPEQLKILRADGLLTVVELPAAKASK